MQLQQSKMRRQQLHAEGQEQPRNLRKQRVMHDFIDTEFIYKHSMLHNTLNQKTKMADFQLQSGDDCKIRAKAQGVRTVKPSSVKGCLSVFSLFHTLNCHLVWSVVFFGYLLRWDSTVLKCTQTLH